ncbi:MAG: thiamine-phosphate kinase [Candidatus Omnitrophica bacterium]|nr:thiamine-phosphate kinase [Candidatus Omnitrophota bacterium]
MLLKNIGEFGLIERFKKQIKIDSSVVAGSGDDCAVLKLDKNNFQLFTCDMIVENEDFTFKDKLELIGRKALAISISDVAACGGIPNHCVVSMGLPKYLSVEKIDRIAKGMFDLARQFRINIVGGDISKAPKLILDVSMLGSVAKQHLVLRNGAKKGDIIFVTGALGGSIRGKHLKFSPRLKESRFLVQNFKVNAMIDISDGLAQDLRHILEQSQVGAVIYECLIPKDRNAKNLEEALFMGEDFELLFTLSKKEAEKLLSKKLKIYKPIGEIVDKSGGLKIVNLKNIVKDIDLKGFSHF